MSFSILLIGCSYAIEAKPPSENLQRVWTRDHGLPDHLVHAVLQTRDGYLWAGTRSGLVRFDGVKFTVFDHGNTPAMQSEVCISLSVDGSSFTLTIEDNNRGFVASALEPRTCGHGSSATGRGLDNMRERMASIGGRFELETSPGHGTTIRLHLTF